MKAEIHQRNQRSIGSSSNQFGGPDRYIAVTISPDGVDVPKALNRSVCEKRGIQLIYCGEYYWNRTGPRSSYARAMNKAKSIKTAVDNGTYKGD